MWGNFFSIGCWETWRPRWYVCLPRGKMRCSFLISMGGERGERRDFSTGRCCGRRLFGIRFARVCRYKEGACPAAFPRLALAFLFRLCLQHPMGRHSRGRPQTAGIPPSVADAVPIPTARPLSVCLVCLLLWLLSLLVLHAFCVLVAGGKQQPLWARGMGRRRLLRGMRIAGPTRTAPCSTSRKQPAVSEGAGNVTR